MREKRRALRPKQHAAKRAEARRARLRDPKTADAGCDARLRVAGAAEDAA
jgi:hypothetical protein